MDGRDTGRIVWMVAASEIFLSGHKVAFIGDGWVPLPSLEGVFTVEAGIEIDLHKGLKAVLRDQIVAILVQPAKLTLKADNEPFGIGLPSGTELHFAEKKVALLSARDVTLIKPETEIVWPGSRERDSRATPDHSVLDPDNKRKLFWLPEAGGIRIAGHASGELRFIDPPPLP